MFNKRHLPELRTYARVEAKLPFEVDASYGSLVVPTGNEALPIHGWFKYKESFSAGLVGRVLEYVGADFSAGSTVRLLDPFCGVGTTLLSAQLHDSQRLRIASVGIECNPFSAFVATSKVSWPLIDSEKFRRLAEGLLAESSSDMRMQLPELSSIRSGRCISRYAARQILHIRSSIELLPKSAERDALLLGLAASIDPVSKVRRDGRALRIVDKSRVSLKQVLRDRWQAMALDVEQTQRTRASPGSAKVLVGDGRVLSTETNDVSKFDLIITSPPYPNNIDYNEVYKLELWLMGFVKTADAFLDLRRRTFRSHPTCDVLPAGLPETKAFADIMGQGVMADLLGMVVRRAKSLDKKNSRGRQRVLSGYVHDTWTSLKAHYGALKPGGLAVYVVGSSLHGGKERPYLIPTDLIVSELAGLLGFQVEKLIVARSLRRRLAGNHFLRDSVIVLRK